ncbi:thioredoxin family protein [Candidatus Thiodiazotropha sp. LNASS1]|uniref:thioredoxin family protein n=1 Tax=Candidatus Thiodiazotropha sp. LNASS1 TaxID=3096260 RepID=UPI00348173FA
MLSLQPQADNLKQLAHLFVLYLLSGSYVAADVGKLTPLEDIQQLSRASKQNRIPILLMVSQYHCGYCDRMKEEVLQPLQLDQAYRHRVLIRELSIDPGEMVTTLQGERQTADEFITQYNVSVTPTLLFLDAEGREAAQRIIGINTVDFLFLYIEAAIDQATAKILSAGD